MSSTGIAVGTGLEPAKAATLGSRSPKAPKPTKTNKALAKLHAKQTHRRLRPAQLPEPSLAIPIADYTTFTTHLHTSRRIFALLGAGLSAASGIPTFRGASGGFWQGRDATQLASPEAFHADPGTVWRFYHERRLAALRAAPNRGHVALAELARYRGADFFAITQNIDGLSERAAHANASLLPVHGSLHEVRCCGVDCPYRQKLGPEDELCKAMPVSDVYCGDTDGSTNYMTEGIEVTIPREALPKCPQCGELLRPAVVWFGEPLPEGARDRIHGWLDEVPHVDLMLVIGTSATVFPAAAYIHAARVQGARIAVFNTEEPSEEEQENPVTKLRDGIDWFFKGSAAEILPEVLKETVGIVTEARMERFRR